MVPNVTESLSKFRGVVVPREYGAPLVCWLEEPATQEEIQRAWPDASLQAELLTAWTVSRETWLFVEAKWHQWGLHLLSPIQSAKQTAKERAERPVGAIRPDDIVVGACVGDLDILVLSPSETGDRRLLVAVELYERPDWRPAGCSLGHFLEQYWAAQGDKFWDPTDHV